MSKALIEKMRRARERTVPAGSHNFTIRRPTVADAERMNGKPPLEWLGKFVVGWDLKESDLDAGGTDQPQPFDADVWAEWVEDQPEIWEPLTLAILALYREQRGLEEEAEKN